MNKVTSFDAFCQAFLRKEKEVFYGDYRTMWVHRDHLLLLHATTAVLRINTQNRIGFYGDASPAVLNRVFTTLAIPLRREHTYTLTPWGKVRCVFNSMYWIDKLMVPPI